MSFSTGLTDPQTELLALLAEELGESVQIVGKIIRHGLHSSHVDYNGTPNVHLLEKELGHVLAAMDKLVGAGIIMPSSVDLHRLEKLDTVRQYLHFN